ncbi:hypothetical protein DM867_04725 [Halosegnis rubeus]|uniref:DUF7282 domain-containing protein n=1 Tax=Halosegnis rubeus TaxID=2212850 RepID=A0A5N5UG45_9EURY|nr:hypothetical protein [Halosegnis rubeus]KAB7516422.1 hypothetical protein DM867_04725 [Halosegnis rubeus]
MTRRLLAVTLVCVLVLASAPLPVAAHLNHVTAGTQQTPDGTVIVESSFASNDGYLTVQRDDGGEPGEVVGVTSIRSQRYRIDVGVTIDESAWAKWETQPVHIVLRRDDGDGEFDPDEDPVVESFGSAATERLTVAKGPRAVVTASETLRPDAEGTVTVRRVTLPETGNLVVQNATTGRTLGTTALDAGTHESVTLAVNATARADARVLLTDDAAGESPMLAGERPIETNVTIAAPPVTDESATPTPPLVTTPSGTATETATDTPRPTETTGSQPGFGLLAGVVAAALLFLGAGRR